MSKRSVLASLLLSAASLALFLWRIRYPHGWSFDEIFYVPAAQALLARTANLNPQHPPLGKLLIAVGVRLFGMDDGSFRIVGTVFGAATVVGMFWWGLAVFRRSETATWIAVLALVNQMLFVQARTAMLDIFLAAFMTWGMAAFCAAWASDVEPQRQRNLVIFSGAMFGFANACKWFGLVPWATALGLVIAAKILQKPSVLRHIARDQAALAEDEPWITPNLFRGVGAGTMLLAFLVAPLVTYFSAFVPMMWIKGVDASWHGLWAAQVRIWQEHNFNIEWVQMSRWYQWPLKIHPMMYAYEPASSSGDYGRYVVLRGNPVVLWSGLAAVLFCLWRWIRSGSRQAFLAVAWYTAMWLSWAVIPRYTTFYYYYLPAALALTVTLGYCAEHLPRRRIAGFAWHWWFAMLAIGFFLYQLPTSSGMRVRRTWAPKEFQNISAPTTSRTSPPR